MASIFWASAYDERFAVGNVHIQVVWLVEIKGTDCTEQSDAAGAMWWERLT